MHLTEIANDTDLEKVRASTGANFIVADNLKRF